MEDIILPYVIPASVALLSSYQLATFAMKVGRARYKFKVKPPETDGDPGFTRTLRAQQNSIEFAPIFLTSHTVASLFFHPIAASVVSLVYIYGRHLYFEGYSRSADDRLPGFKLSTNALKALIVMGVTGVTLGSLKYYAGIDVKKYAFDAISKYWS
ncbi:microsomal glutathione S-transferase 2-like [Anneissia japonica]|uniref:microsomal glutathione S-transferase 2-like n=1 Tax=Anneissia japonica TaxID=1529436 RepID=UPI001425B912|nr:microsomal glutathione S-transferase 2-like [Anneissia japonica]